MAVEAHHINLFPSQLLANREIIKHGNLLNADLYNAQMDSALPLPTTTAALPESLLAFYQSSFGDAKASMNKADSGLTYHVPAPRKRSRDLITELNALPISQKSKISSQSAFLDQEIVYQIQQQQTEIDRLIAHHTEKIRMELEDQRMRQSRTLLCAIQDAMVKKLKEKDEEIQRVGKMNWVLQERVKSLCVENQIWRELAQTNEATANSLRSNLEQVLAHVTTDDYRQAAAGGAAVADPVADDAQSSCGSNHDEAEDRNDTAATAAVGGGECDSGRMCKNCGVRESVVLVLPCRHLCLCTMCGSTIRSCPVCHSSMNASVHVNFS
ncbi:hypothetical protein L6164_036893 [Bauhinia variegata]|uniref:Uncharacterized protein n=1 Tax=Bauhinia variegata TaxID=167791 RepID=A0ACB9KIA5_BAUVA|nr:hypothetical protein L6164_036893 [Bauhinia variegata]